MRWDKAFRDPCTQSVSAIFCPPPRTFILIGFGSPDVATQLRTFAIGTGVMTRRTFPLNNTLASAEVSRCKAYRTRHPKTLYINASDGKNMNEIGSVDCNSFNKRNHSVLS